MSWHRAASAFAAALAVASICAFTGPAQARDALTRTTAASAAKPAKAAHAVFTAAGGRMDTVTRMPRGLEHPTLSVAAASAAYQRSHPGAAARTGGAAPRTGGFMKGQLVALAEPPAGPRVTTASAAAAVLPASDPNAGYNYVIPTADQCRNNPQAASQYGWRPNHYAYCQVYIYHWTYFNPLPAATGQDRVTLIGQGSYGNDPTRNGGDGRIVTFTLNVDQVQVTSGTLPAGSTLTFGMTCYGDPAGSCQTTSPPVTLPDQQWNNNSATFTYTSPDGVGYNGGGKISGAWNWAAFAYGSFFWAVFPNCTGCTNNAQVNGPAGSLRFDGPGSADMPTNHQTGATFQPVDSTDNQLVDTMALGYNGMYVNTSYAIAAHHYYVALNYPNSTYPLTGNKTIPDEFTRMFGSLGRILSGQVAIPLCRTVWGDRYATAYGLSTDGNPLQCDEFPFASTYQGNPVRNGLPDGTSMSVCPLNGPDNGSAGNALSAFYRQQRIFDGNGTTDTDPHDTDWFNIQFTGVPTPAPTAAQALPCPVPNPRAPGTGLVVVDNPAGGAFLDAWDGLADQDGPLGDVTADSTAITGGQEQAFTSGAIYWSAATGTHGIYGPAATDYTTIGGPGSPLGFPASDPVSEPGGGVEWQFNGTNCGTSGLTGSGAVIMAGGPAYTAGTTSPAAEVQGCIYQAYTQQYGGPSGSLGYPTANEQAIGTGRVSYFTGGSTEPGCSTGSEPGDGVTTAAIYWDGTAHDVTGCVFALYHSLGEATGQLGFPIDDAYPVSGGGTQQDFQNGTISGSNGSYSVSYQGQWVVGHAAHAGNDYPYETVGQFEHQGEGTDAWNEYYGQCDSFAAWKAYENLAGSAAQEPNAPVPAVGWQPSNASVSPVNQDTWFNADNWDVKAKAAGWVVNTIPAPGAIAYWPNATTDPQDGHPTSANGMGEFGHVGYVTDVYPDGSVTIEGYNLRLNGEYSVLHMSHGQSAVDTSFNQGSFTVPWPTYFIHVGDGIGSPTPASPEPASGTVSADYPSQVKVIGPGSSASQFSLGNVWYPRPGHGEIGEEEWTHTNGATAVSTATWTPSGLAGSACYRVDAFVPDNYSDNPIAVYTVADAKGTATAAVNDNAYTNDWAELGVYETNGSGGITVRLDDRGTTGLYVAADAMRFWRQASCSGYGDVSPILGPGSLSSGWSTDSGHGFFGSESYSATHGAVVQDYATYSPHLLAMDCYEVYAYVPDNYADNTAAIYEILDQWHGDFWPQVNENVFTNQFTDLGAFMARSDGSLPVTLEDLGPAGQYVAADALAFTLDPSCVGVGESGTGLGNVYQSGQVGPGSPPALFTTTNAWFTRLGHGYTQHELWTYDNGSTEDSTATWTFYGSANACYSVAAYIPDNLADNPQAHYGVGTSSEGVGLTLNQQDYTNQFVHLATVTTGSDGIVTVHLDDLGPVTDSSGDQLYTAADAMQFSQGGSGC
jgi:surface antigen